MLKQLLHIKKQRQKGLKDKVQSLKKAKLELSELMNAMQLQRDENVQAWKELSVVSHEVSHADLVLLQKRLCTHYENEQKLKIGMLERSNDLTNFDQSIHLAEQAVQRNLVEQEKLHYLINEVH